MAKQYDVVAVPVEEVRRGDALTLSGDADPRTHVFYVARVDVMPSMDTGEVPRIVLTSKPVNAEAEPMVLEYPTGTPMRKIVGIKSV